MSMTTLAEVRADTNRCRDEIHTLVLRNTRLQRDIMTLHTGRERAAAEGAQAAQELADELAALDDELRHVRAQCHSMRRALNNQRTDADRLGEHMSDETSMSSTRFRRMSTAILGPNAKTSSSSHEPSQGTTTERARGMSIASTALKRRDSVMSRFRGMSVKKTATAGNTPRAHSGGDSMYEDDEDEVDDDNRSVDIDDASPESHSVDIDDVSSDVSHMMLSEGMLHSEGSSKSLSSSTSSTSSTSSSTSGRPPLRHNSGTNVLQYKASDEKKSTADAHKEHLSNFRRSSRSSRKIDLA